MKYILLCVCMNSMFVFCNDLRNGDMVPKITIIPTAVPPAPTAPLTIQKNFSKQKSYLRTSPAESYVIFTYSPTKPSILSNAYMLEQYQSLHREDNNSPRDKR